MKGKILLIDDDPQLLRSIEKMLTNYGYDITAIDNGRKALELISKEIFSLIIMDIRMPDQDGLELLNTIREMQGCNEQSNVIIITGYASEDAPIKAIKLGAADYLMKPFETVDLLSSIEKSMKLVTLDKEKFAYLKSLKDVNTKLTESNKKMQQVCVQLANSQKIINDQNIILEHKNIALKELLAQISAEKQKIRDDIFREIDREIIPLIKGIKTHKYIKLKRIIVDKINAISTGVVPSLHYKRELLTQRERQVSYLISRGLKSREIAASLGIAKNTVDNIRKNIRKKLGAKKKEYLNTILE
ncbi:MAG: response regulator [Elusimicrobiota bacterium]